MTADLNELYECAALADWIYARTAVDQAIQLGEVSQSLILRNVDDELIETPTMRREPNGLYYSDRGFVGAIVQDGTNFIVVLRGSDMGTAGPSEILSSFVNGEGRTQIDGEDWQQNALIGNGAFAGVTQAEDAVALTNAAIAMAGGTANVRVVGQSLGGGLAGLVAGICDVKSYAMSPAPFANYLETYAKIGACLSIGASA